jgi:hypothetical protein
MRIYTGTQLSASVHLFWLHYHCNNWLISLPCVNSGFTCQVSMSSWRWESSAVLPTSFASVFFFLCAGLVRENDGALYLRWCVSVEVATQSRRDSSVHKPLSRFVHPEVPCKVTGQFPPLFTDAPIIWKVMTRTSLGPGSSLQFVLAVVFCSEPASEPRLDLQYRCNTDHSVLWLRAWHQLIDRSTSSGLLTEKVIWTRCGVRPGVRRWGYVDELAAVAVVAHFQVPFTWWW